MGCVPFERTHSDMFSNSLKNNLNNFMLETDNVMKRDSELFSCNEAPYPVPQLEALVVLDGSWTSWEAQRVIGYEIIFLHALEALYN
jgi:hypothetical protein